MKRVSYAICVSVWTVAFLCGCEHKDLCYIHNEHALKYHAVVAVSYKLDWQYTIEKAIDWRMQWPERFGMEYRSICPDTPNGLRVLVYNSDKKYNMINIPPEGGVVPMTEGEHSLLFYNNDTEHILFSQLESTASAQATTRTRSRVFYMGSGSGNGLYENTVNPPDMLFGSYIESYWSRKIAEPELIPITMKPLVFTYLIRYEFSHGLKYVALTRGALAGMATSVYLNSGRTSEGKGTLLYDCSVEDFGAQALVNSFGIPDYPNEGYIMAASAYLHMLNLEVRLKNGKIMNFDFDVTEQVEAQPHGGVIVVEGIEVPDEEGQKGSSGFDVDVDDWGEYEDIDLPLIDYKQ